MSSIHESKKIEHYIDGLDCRDKSYNNIIIVEHRKNNSKRDFLFVNKLQCKHVPSSPTLMINMCESLGKLVELEIKKYNRIAVIAFSETATAIGYFVAKKLQNCGYFITTTRENIGDDIGSRLVQFKEEHSHAVNQELYSWSNKKDVLKNYEYILFVEDEISTGNTIINFVKALNDQYAVDKDTKFGVASICNWQDEKNIEIFKQYNIDRYALINGELKDVNVKMNDIRSINGYRDEMVAEQDTNVIGVTYSNRNNITFLLSRLGAHKESGDKLEYTIKQLHNRIIFNNMNIRNIRVIGTEECMHPAIILGSMLEDSGYNVKCHSSTRSCIDTMNESNMTNDELVQRVKIPSAYDKDRNTYIYNIDNEDDIIICVTDSLNTEALEKFKCSVQGLFKKEVIFLEI